MYKLTVFIPEENTEAVKAALFTAGAGKYGQYDCCSWQVKGTGQFRPLQGSNPSIGSHNIVETVSEYRVEMIVEERFVDSVISALRESHPYEEPAFDIIKLHNS